MALDVFWIQDSNSQPYEKLLKLSDTIKETLMNDFKPQPLIEAKSTLRDRTRVFAIAPRVLVDINASSTYTVIEVNARDRGGLLYDVTRTLRELRRSIGAARITTYGVRAVDFLYFNIESMVFLLFKKMDAQLSYQTESSPKVLFTL